MPWKQGQVMTEQKPSKSIIKMGIGFVFSGWLLAYAGEVIPLIGALGAILAPNVFLFGITFFAYAIAGLLPVNMVAKFIVALIFATILGLNTRLLTLVEDVINGTSDQLVVLSRLEGR